MKKIKKGSRVRITTGEGEGELGSVFWTGKDRYNDGLRLGIRGDDGETYWTSDTDVEISNEKVDAGPTYSKGDRVRFSNNGEPGTGTVFWTGDSRQGPGQRIGVRDDHGEEAVWLDSRQAEPLSEADDEGVPEKSPSEQSSGGYSGTESSSGADEWSAPALSMDEQPPAPPMDDSYLDQLSEPAEAAPTPSDW